MGYVETSAVLNINIEYAIKQVVQKICEKELEKQSKI